MPDKYLATLFNPKVTHHDWIVMLKVLSMYRHNKDYSAVYDRMADEAKKAGIPLPDRLSPEIKHKL